MEIEDKEIDAADIAEEIDKIINTLQLWRTIVKELAESAECYVESSGIWVNSPDAIFSIADVSTSYNQSLGRVVSDNMKNEIYIASKNLWAQALKVTEGQELDIRESLFHRLRDAAARLEDMS